MANRVTGVRSALLALTGIVFLSSLGVSTLGFSQGIDWDNGAQFNAESAGFIGPQLLPTELDEDSEVQTGDSQSELEPARNASAKTLTPEQEQQIRVAYGTYLASRVGAGDGIVAGQVRQIQPVGRSEPVADNVQAISPEDVVEEDVLTTASIALEKTISNIDEIDDTLVAPVPAPFALRPVLPVRPAGVAVIQPARAVSVDHLVHVDVPGSWPRRLDQVNNGNFVSIVQNGQNSGGNIFLRDWQNNPQGAAQPRQFNNAPVNNTSESFPASVMFAGRAN